MITARRLLLSGAAALLVACGGGRAAVKPERVEPLAPEAAAPDVERPRPRAARVLAPSERIDEVLAQARGLLDRHQVQVKGKTFRYDCSGFVRGVFSVLGIDLMSEAGEDGDNGVRLIHHYVGRHGQNHARPIPQKGDVVYFDNTWDKNGNGKLDDPLTHVGVVEEIEPDGTVQILHRANRGIVRDPMNLLRPHQTTSDGKRPINAILRPKGRRDPAATPHLLSELWAGFGTVAASPSGESREGPSAPLLELLACGCEAP